MSQLKICPVCSTEYPANERFCPRDGTALRTQGEGSKDLVGTIIAERYHIIKKLGEGGMGQVYLAEHVKMGRKSAVKVMNPGMVTNVDAISRFNREAQNASRINHPNVAGIYDFGETPDGLVYLAMEFVEGEPLTEIIKQHGALPPMRASEITRQAAEGLSVAHDMGIVHRDLKPDNIMIGKGRGGSDLVKVVDFGIAKAAANEQQKVTKTGMVVGTPEYMSPEQLSGDPLDARSDIYALALVAFNMFTGKLPFPGETMQESMIMRLTDEPKQLLEMKPDVAWPADLQAVMNKALARSADQRYGNASQFAHDLVQAIDRMPVTSITAMGTEVLKRMSANSMHKAQTAATVQVNVPKTRVASKEEAAPVARPSASPAVTPTKSKTGMYAGIGGVLVAAGVGAVFLLKGGSKPGPDTTNSPPAATVPKPDTTHSVTSSGNPGPSGVTEKFSGSVASTAVNDTLGVLERRMDAVDLTRSDSVINAAAQKILDKAIDLNATAPIAKIRRALLIYDANLAMNNKQAACDAMLAVKDFALTTPNAPGKTTAAMNACK